MTSEQSTETLEGTIWPDVDRALSGITVRPERAVIDLIVHIPRDEVVRGLRAFVWFVAAIGAAGVLSVLMVGPWRLDLAGLRLSASDVDKPLLLFTLAGVAGLLLSRTALAMVRQRSTAGFYLCAAFARLAKISPESFFNCYAIEADRQRELVLSVRIDIPEIERQ